MRLYKRGGVWHYDFMYHGVRVRKSTNQSKKYLAELQLNDDMQKARDNGGAHVLLRTVPTLETFAVDFLKWVEDTESIGKHAKKLYPRGWRLLKDTPLAKKPMDDIFNHDCETVKFPGTTNANANCALRTLRRMFSKAKEMKQLFGDRPKIELREEWPRSIAMSESDAVLIDSHWKPGERSQSSRDAFRIISSSGMRPSECFEMRWEYIHWDLAVYQNPKGKTKTSRRHVPLNFPPFDCMSILKVRHAREGSPAEGWIFPANSACGHMTTINKPFIRARNRAGLPQKMVLYCARHGVSTAVADVATLKETMQILGHSDVKTALGYQHPNSKQVGERLWDRMRTNGSVQ